VYGAQFMGLAQVAEPDDSEDPFTTDPIPQEEPVQQYSTQIPDGLVAGDTFQVTIGEAEINLTVPAGKSAGDTYQFELPLRQELNSAAPSSENEIVVESAQTTMEDPGDLQFSTLVPEGLHPGDLFTVTIGEETLTLTVPADKGPGDTVLFELPAPEDNASPLSEATPELPVTQETLTYKAQVPEGLMPGQTFHVTIQGTAYELTVPDDKLPGDVFDFEIPKLVDQSELVVDSEVLLADEFSHFTALARSLGPPRPEKEVKAAPTLPPPVEDQPQATAPPQTQQAPPKQFTAQVPPGYAPGMQFQVQVDGQTITLTVPPGKAPGETWIFDVPAPQQPAPQQQPAKQFTAQVPPGFSPGMQFQVQVEGQTITLTVPPGKAPGDTWTFDVPQQQPAAIPELPPPRQFSAQVPPGFVPGQQFQVQVEGQVITLTVPNDKSPGDTFTFDVPASQADLQTPGATPPAQTQAPPKQFTAQVPPGFVPGQQFQVQVEGQVITLTVPVGKAPGESFTFDVPQQQPVATPDAAAQPQAQAPPKQFQAQVPPGFVAGQTFQVQVEGQVITLTVPEGKAPGETFTFDVPQQAPASTSNPASSMTQMAATPPKQFQAQVPPGFVPGQTFQVQVEGQTITLTVPAGKAPGETFTFEVPQPQSAAAQTPPAKQFQAQVPPGFVPGQQFQVSVEGQTITLTVPAGKAPGETFTFEVPAKKPAKKYTIAVPEELESGKSFEVQAEGVIFSLTVPEGKVPGETFSFEMPQQVAPPPKKFTLTVPAGISPGQSFKYPVDGNMITLQAPRGKNPGDTFILELPSNQEPHQVMHEEELPPESDIFRTQIPAGIYPGEMFSLPIDGKMVVFTCPMDKKAGDPFEFYVPPRAQEEGSIPDPASIFVRGKEVTDQMKTLMLMKKLRLH